MQSFSSLYFPSSVVLVNASDLLGNININFDPNIEVLNTIVNYISTNSQTLCSINVLGDILSGGKDLSEIFLTSETESQQLDYNINNNALTISKGNTVYLSAFDDIAVSKKLIIDTDSTEPSLRVTQRGSGPVLLIEDEASPDPTPFTITSTGQVILGSTSTPLLESTQWLHAASNMADSLRANLQLTRSGLETGGRSPARLRLIRTRGTLEAPLKVEEDDEVGGILWGAYTGGGDSSLRFPGSINVYIDGPTNSINAPGRMTFATAVSANSGVSTLQRHMCLDSRGNLGVGTITPNERLTVVGNISTNQYGDASQWNSVFTVVSALSAEWQESPDLPTIQTFLSTNNITISAANFLDSLSIFGNISGYNLRTSFNQGSATGNFSFAVNQGRAFGQYSFAVGSGAIAAGLASHAEGFNTRALGNYSHAQGKNTVALAESSHAEGENSQAQGIRSHAEGFESFAIGNWGAHAEGRVTYAAGDNSHTEGQNTYTGPNATGAHAEGGSTEALGQHAHAEGFRTRAVGRYSHAGGNLAESLQNFTYAWACGDLQINNPFRQVATTRTGQYMVSASGGMFIPGRVGIGTDSIDNALTVVGNISATSTIYTNDILFPGDQPIIKSNTAVESSSVGLSAIDNIIVLTEAAYNALSVKRPTTYYIIV